MRSCSPSRATGVVLLLLASWQASPAIAQSPGGFTVKGGLVSSDFGAGGTAGAFGGVSTGVDSFGVPGFGGGVATRVHLDGRFGLQLEALWLRKASDIEIRVVPFPAFGEAAFFARARADYLELPVLLRYELGSGSTRPYLLGGPSLAIRLGSSLSGGQLDQVVDAGLLDESLEDDMRRTDFVLGIGAGVDFTADRPTGWSFELRAAWGLTRMFDDLADQPVPTDIRARTRAFLALVGFRL